MKFRKVIYKRRVYKGKAIYSKITKYVNLYTISITSYYI